MATSSLLALIDDIASLLDDVATLTKVAATKTAGVLGDDLAVNAQQVSGVHAQRELPIVWAVAKGSLVNKAILVPAALAISAVVPWAVTPLLMIGALFLCYEGFEKVAHSFSRRHAKDDAHLREQAQALAKPGFDIVALEKNKIRGAVRTDFILSAEIIVISLGVVASAPFIARVTTLIGVALLMTVGVYGLVAAIVKLDDLGLYLSRNPGTGALARGQSALGRAILRFAPWFMKALSVAGTAAMFLVGGAILVHGVPMLHHAIEGLSERAGDVAIVGRLFAATTALLLDAATGAIAGAAVYAVLMLIARLRAPKPSQAR